MARVQDWRDFAIRHSTTTTSQFTPTSNPPMGETTMSESHYSYSVPVQSNDSTLTPEEKQRQSEQFRQPGRVRFTPGVGVEYEQVESAPVTTPANILADPLNHAQDLQGKAVDLWDRGSLQDSEIRVPTPDGKGGIDYMLFS